jgi:site-specific recombinase XerC
MAKPGLWMRALFECGYSFGWRVGELLGLTMRQVDLVNREVRLEPDTTKNREGRTAAMTEGVFSTAQGLHQRQAA